MKKKNDAMSSKQIEEKGVPVVLNKKFHELPVKKRKKGVILNLDNKGPGTHWVAMKEQEPGVYRYFDSFGVRPSYDIVKNSLILYNPIQKQKFSETNCGQRSIQWLKSQNKKK